MAAAKETAAPKKFKVTIHSEPEGGDKGDVIIGHNFRLVQIKRNVPVEIDEHILDVLKSSVIDTHVKGADDKMVPVQIPRYSFTSEAL
jgi:hypothetical protein